MPTAGRLYHCTAHGHNFSTHTVLSSLGHKASGAGILWSSCQLGSVMSSSGYCYILRVSSFSIRCRILVPMYLSAALFDATPKTRRGDSIRTILPILDGVLALTAYTSFIYCSLVTIKSFCLLWLCRGRWSDYASHHPKRLRNTSTHLPSTSISALVSDG